MLNARLPPASSPAPQPPDSEDIAADIHFDRIQTVYELTPPPTGVGLVFALVVAALMWPLAPPVVTLGWLLPKLLLGSLRLADAWAFHRASQRREHARRWRLRYLMLLAVDGMAWGAMAVVFLPYAQGLTHTLLLAAPVGVAAVGMFTTFSHWATSLVLLGSVLTPIIVDQLRLGGRDNLYTAASVAIYLLVMAFESWRADRRQGETLKLRYQNAWIAQQRQQALVLAEHSSSAKSRFLAAVSHEMRTPLNGILGMTQLLRATVQDPEHAHQLEVMRRSARHLQTVIADLLDLSRIEFGRLELAQEPFNLQDTVREVTDLLSAVAEEKGLVFELKLLPPLPRRVIGDAARIKQVLHNLLGNAIKFTREGTVALQVRATPQGLRFSVQDSGEGIPPAEAQRVFDAFAQAGSAPSRRAGTGLGLTISRQLARAMGGDVQHEPAASGGAIFHLDLPAPTAADDDDGDGPWQPMHFQFHGRVLVVDDSPVNAMVAQAMLERFGLQVQLADDGQEALQALGRTRFDAVLMDCEMPGLDGLEATARWRAHEQNQALPATPIIAVTANAVAGERERCLAAGMDDYLTKPFDLNELGLLLGRHLRAADNAAHAFQPTAASD